VNKVVTALKFAGRGRDRVDIYLDGEKDFTLIKSIAMKLKVGQELSPDQLQQLKDWDLEEQVYQQCLRLISLRSRSEQELRDRIKRTKANVQIQDSVIQRLKDTGLVDDPAFAKEWVENRLAFRPRSAWALKQELRQKGIANSTIQNALREFDDEDAAYKAASKAARKLAEGSWDHFERRLTAYLRRRGFQYSTISTVVKKVWMEKTGAFGESED